MSGEERRESIVRAAMVVFAEKGFARATTRDLAEAAGISEALLYRHFDSKESIYEHIQDAICDRNTPELNRIMRRPVSTAGMVLVVYALHQYISSRSSEDADGHKMVMRLMMQSSLEDGRFIKSFHDARFARLIPFFSACADAAVVMGDLVPGPMSHAERFWLAHHVIVGRALANLPPVLPYEYDQADPAVRAQNGFVFTLRGIGLTDEAIERHANSPELHAAFAAVNEVPVEVN